jgi:hypothetical protein
MKSGMPSNDLAGVDVLRTYVPAIFFLTCTCIVYFVRTLCLWEPTRALLGVFSRPFQSFLTLDDISEYNSSIKRVEVPAIEGKWLRALCFTQAVGWVFWAITCTTNGGRVLELAGPALLALSWVGSA